MAVSGRKSDMSKGRLNDAIVKFTNTEWVEDTTKNGKDIVQLSTVFEDADGQPHPYNFMLGEQKYVRVEDGKLVSVDDSREYQMSGVMPAGKLCDSLDDAGFSPKKLLNIGDAPEALDGQWVHVKQVPSAALKTDGTPFTDLLVVALVDDPSKSSKSSSKSEDKKSGKGKAAARVEEAEEDDDEETAATDDESDDDDSDGDDDVEPDDEDPINSEALQTVVKILADPAEYVRNFDEEANDGGISIKQAYTAAFTAFKGDKKAKGPVCNLINDPNFHKANAKAGEYQFDSKQGILTANPSKPAAKKRK